MRYHVKPPAYGLPSEEECERKAKTLTVLFLATYIIIQTFLICRDIHYGLGYVVSEALISSLFLLFGLSFPLWMFYHTIKSAPKNLIDTVSPYIRAVNPEVWAVGGFFKRWVVMKKGSRIYALLMGFDCKLVICESWRECNEKPTRLGHLRLIDEIKIGKSKFKVFRCDFAIIPSPTNENKAILCEKPKIVVLSKWSGLSVKYADFLKIVNSV